MNNINLIGNICNDVELKQTTNGKTVVTINLAVKRPFTKDQTDFIPIVAWDKQAELLKNYTHKGSKIGVSGTLSTREWKDTSGQNRKVFEVVVNAIDLLDSKTADIPNQDFKPHVEPKFEEVDTNQDLPF